jgi:hypothetical protein
MKLFSEKVSPTFTSSNLNILTVKEFVEVFFDVFEFEINGNKFIAEKISEYKGFPVVEVPLVFEGKKLTAPFVLQQGEFEVLFNPDVSTIIGEAAEETPEPLIEYKESDDEIEELVLEKKETILKEIAQAKHSAAKYIERLKQQKLRETEEYLEEKQKIIETDLQESKKDLLEEFLVLVENVKSEFYSFNEDEKSRLEKFIESSIDRVSNELILSINHNRESAEERFSIHIDELANKVLTGVLLKEINHNNDKSVKDINTRFASISKSIETLFESNNKVIFDRVSNTLKDFNSTILTLEKSNIEIVDKLSKTNNKVLSRIGNVKNKLEESIAETTGNLIDRIEATESKIINYYNTNISLIENSLSGLVGESKNYFISLINESKQSLLEQIANLKVDVPNIVIERSRGGRQEIDLKGIKIELEKNISSRFSNEIQSLKRLIEMSSGGGSVAVQFADGGTMNGDLTIVGTISASQYLGIPIYTDTDTLSTVTGRGNTTNDSITVGGVNTPYVVTNSINVNTLSAITLSADRIFTTQLDALSANITVIDIKQYELSGFNVQGNATVQGSISASGTITADNISVAGNLTVDTNTLVVDSVNNRVGIGTSTPAAQLEITNTSDTQGLIINQNASQTENPFEIKDSGGNNIFTIDPQGNTTITNQIQQDLKLILKNEIGEVGTDSSNVQVWGQNKAFFSGHNNSGTQLFNFGYDSNIGGLATIGYGGGQSISINSGYKVQIRRGTDSGDLPNRLNVISYTDSEDVVMISGHSATQSGDLLQFRDYKGGSIISVVTADGSFGIGTATPSAKLTVVGTISASQYLGIPIYTDTDTLSTVTGRGNTTTDSITVGGILASTLGVGATPVFPYTRTVKLHDDGVQFGARLALIGTTDNGFPGIEMVTDGNLAKRTLIRHEGEGSNNYGLSFFTTNNGVVAEKVRFDGDGNVGIGTTTPSEKLEVNGDLMLQQDGVIKNKNNNTQFRFGVNDLYLDSGHLRAAYSVGIRGNRGSTKGLEQGSTLNSDLGIFCGGNEAISIHSDGDALVNNNLEVGGTTTVGKITLSENSFVIATSSFTISEEHRGATVLLQNPAPMTVTISPQVSGHVTTFIAETSNIVNFASGAGLSGLNSFNEANSMLGQFAQAQIIFKTPEYAFLGGQIT